MAYSDGGEVGFAFEGEGEGEKGEQGFKGEAAGAAEDRGGRGGGWLVEEHGLVSAVQRIGDEVGSECDCFSFGSRKWGEEGDSGWAEL